MNKTFHLKNNFPFLKRKVIITEKELPPYNKRKPTDWWICGNNPDFIIISDLCAYLYQEAWAQYPSKEDGYGEARGYFVSQLFKQAVKKIAKKVYLKIENGTWSLTNCTPNIDLKFIYGDLEYCGEICRKHDHRKRDEEKEKLSGWCGRNWYNPEDEFCRRKNKIHLAVRTQEKETSKVRSTEEIAETFVHELQHVADRTKKRHSNMGVQPMTMFYRWLVRTTLKKLEFSFSPQ